MKITTEQPKNATTSPIFTPEDLEEGELYLSNMGDLAFAIESEYGDHIIVIIDPMTKAITAASACDLEGNENISFIEAPKGYTATLRLES